MCPDERKTILVLLDILDRYLPALHGMALIAIGSHLPTMNISVALGALVSYIGKNELAVALRAAD